MKVEVVVAADMHGQTRDSHLGKAKSSRCMCAGSGYAEDGFLIKPHFRDQIVGRRLIPLKANESKRFCVRYIDASRAVRS